VALLTNGDVDDVTAVLIKIGSFRLEMYYENHMELCLAAKQTLVSSLREIPEVYISWAKSRNFWAYISKKERSSVKPEAFLPLQNEGNRPLFIRLLAHAIVGLVRSSDDALLRSLLQHSFITISSAAAIRCLNLSGTQLWVSSRWRLTTRYPRDAAVGWLAGFEALRKVCTSTSSLTCLLLVIARCPTLARLESKIGHLTN
jgi:hypothetical protein